MLTFLKTTFHDLRAFVAAPFDRRDEDADFAYKVKRLFSTLLIGFALSAVCIGLVSLVAELGFVDLEQHAGNDLINNLSYWQLVLAGVFIMPLLEEFIFRRPLRFGYNLWTNLVLLFTPKADGMRDARRAELRAWWDRNYRWIFYGIALLFGYVHLANFELTPMIVVFSPILVLAQIVLGVLMGFLRVRYGFWWGYAMHALHNFTFLSVGFLALQPSTVVDYDGDRYHMEVQEVVEESTAAREHYNGLDSMAFTNTPLREVLQTLLASDVTFQPEDHQIPNLNVFFGAEVPDVDGSAAVLEQLGKQYKFTVEGSPDARLVRFAD